MYPHTLLHGARRFGCTAVMALLLGAAFSSRLLEIVSAAQPSLEHPVLLSAPLSAEGFTRAVLTENASLEAMRQAVIAAVTRIKPAGALDDPMLSVSAAPRTIGSAMGLGGDVEVSQTLPWWGTLHARTEVARAEAEAASDDLDALKLHLAALARGTFSDWVYVHRALDINTANEALLTELRNTARIRYATGQAPQEDVLQADVERSMLRQDRLSLTRDEITVQARMNALLELAPQEPIPDPAALPSPADLPAEELLAGRALAHPQLQMLEADEQAATAQERLAEKERYPKFGVSAGYNGMWSDPAMRPMVGLSITVPIDQGKYRAEIDAARAEAHRAASSVEDARASVLADLAADYASVREASQSLALYRNELVPLARSTLDVARAEYASGRGDFLNVLTAEQHRLGTELGLARVQSEYFERLAELDRAQGGGLINPGESRDSAGAEFNEGVEP